MRQDRDPVAGRHASCQKDSRQTIDPPQQFAVGQSLAAVLDGQITRAVLCAGSKDRIQISAPCTDDVGQHGILTCQGFGSETLRQTHPFINGAQSIKFGGLLCPADHRNRDAARGKLFCQGAFRLLAGA